MIQARNFLKAAARMFRRNRRKQREQTPETPTPQTRPLPTDLVRGIDPRHALTKADMTRPANKPTPALNPRHGSSPLRNLSQKQRAYARAWIADTGPISTRTKRVVHKIYGNTGRKTDITRGMQSAETTKVLAAIDYLRARETPNLVERYRNK